MNMATDPTQISPLTELLQRQRASYLAAPNPDYAIRKERLTRLKTALLNYQQPLVEALSQDYGHRSTDDSLISDIMPVVNNINYSLKNLKKWLKPSRRHAGILLAPAQVKVHYQPLGVIGIIVPWNFPVMLSIGPLVTAIAAGNHAMLKLSEFTPATNKVIKQLLTEVFDESHVAIVEGEADVAAQFSALPFDHLLFTGSTTVGRHVMRAAANNLTPVTLELGGKSPVIIAPDMPLEIAVERMIYGKCLNAGQICVAPDYVLCPNAKVNDFIQAYQAKFLAMYGEVAKNKDYGSIINARQFDRLMAVLEDAKTKGAKIISASNEAIDSLNRKIPTQLITHTTEDMQLMQEEIFGPLLPIIGYDTLDEAIRYINLRARPLALYVMSFDEANQQKILQQTHSGGVCINETVFHVAADDAPFGGIGPSGMGHYHGKEGFLTFSHAKTVLSRGRFNTGKFVHPPYGTFIQRMLMKLFLR
ncbi:coniferyl aldehyde dehydrogenase [Shewanella oneidensis MR-1]|uniref:Aldehyde dehydrogenase n=1 Tax=Shewanella oneidensis (strain ATCC 700550 / JCM 31522 / CIP 106686 / LMG 19005 / NCIMB 14063 / MR-1) TaxID=211586 RepID=Q8EB51_SHEON|nr:coniferyl aldehyde dehydrogenase [Shewanella oneidensis]AAN56668.1 coniferyl aldehyde dehydrogenase CalB [Shewanella oneidensis MR-1]MDX5998947.1 coniferyl aldehyde dehydrogenase [Shewanella oneidensis]MEE2027525.1 Coniferyl aldehyde dehydrogenase [Shewanella oneidensis]QKG98020.1 coniferyl aldehyde dehydrogenase [Shewanella oneidensis MR-1]